MTTVRFVTWQPYNFVLFFSIVFGYRHWLTQIVVVEFYKKDSAVHLVSGLHFKALPDFRPLQQL